MNLGALTQTKKRFNHRGMAATKNYHLTTMDYKGTWFEILTFKYLQESTIVSENGHKLLCGFNDQKTDKMTKLPTKKTKIPTP